MASNNRATRINKVLKVVKRRFQPAAPPNDRSVLEHLLFACGLENSLHEHASTVFHTLSSDYFDWNEVRVTSIRELAEVMRPLNDPVESATRLKRVLQSVFEMHYSFDLEPMRKQNIGQTVKQLHKYNGTSSFTVAYTTQNALEGHSIPINAGLLESMRVVGVISDGEYAKGTVPGLERAVPKSKGVEVGTLLHQLGVEYSRSPYGPAIRKLLLEIDPQCKDQLPKRSIKKAEPPVEEKPPAPASSKPQKKAAEVKKSVAKRAPAKKPAPAKKKVTKKPTKKAAAKKPAAKKKPVAKKKTKTAKKAAKKPKSKTTPKRKKTSVTKKLKKRKPR